jgi:hypothetical protein
MSSDLTTVERMQSVAAIEVACGRTERLMCDVISAWI